MRARRGCGSVRRLQAGGGGVVGGRGRACPSAAADKQRLHLSAVGKLRPTEGRGCCTAGPSIGSLRRKGLARGKGGVGGAPPGWGKRAGSDPSLVLPREPVPHVRAPVASWKPPPTAPDPVPNRPGLARAPWPRLRVLGLGFQDRLQSWGGRGSSPSCGTPLCGAQRRLPVPLFPAPREEAVCAPRLGRLR